MTSLLVKLPEASEATRASVVNSVISTSRGDNSSLGIEVTLRGNSLGTSGIRGWTSVIVLVR